MDRLKHGDEVEIRTAAEILETLDASGSTESLPFMPEMVALCGRRFLVDATAERLCDTIEWSGAMRIPGTVLLGSLRCDGAGHDGCEGECRLLWKSAWLRCIAPGEPARPVLPDEAVAREKLLALTRRNTRPVGEGSDPALYRCQTTELRRASAPASRFPYVGELTSGNVPPARYLRVVARAAVWETKRKLGKLSWKTFDGNEKPVRREPLNLAAGEWVRIRSRKEIEETIDTKGGTRGLWFDREMLQYCGRVFRVKQRVTHFLHDDGRMVRLKSAALKLEGVTCAGDYSVGRWFCPRALHPYWREDWLERAEAPPVPPAKSCGVGSR